MFNFKKFFRNFFYKKVFPKNNVVDLVISLGSTNTSKLGKERFSYEIEMQILQKIALESKSLLDSGGAKQILFCGGKFVEGKINEEEIMRFSEWFFMRKFAFPEQKISFKTAPICGGKTTKEKATKVADVLRMAEINSAIVVTSSKDAGRIFCRRIEKETRGISLSLKIV